MKIPKVFIKKNSKIDTEKNYDGKLSDLVLEEFKKIDYQADFKKKEIEYTAMLAEEYWNILKEIVEKQKKDESLDNLKNLNLQKNDKPLESRIFDKAKEALKKLEAYSFPFGVTMHYGKPEDYEDTALLLGWAKLDLVSNSYDAYAYKLTDEGREIINRLRKISGQPRLKD